MFWYENQCCVIFTRVTMDLKASTAALSCFLFTTGYVSFDDKNAT